MKTLIGAYGITRDITNHHCLYIDWFGLSIHFTFSFHLKMQKDPFCLVFNTDQVRNQDFAKCFLVRKTSYID